MALSQHRRLPEVAAKLASLTAGEHFSPFSDRVFDMLTYF
jgi:hypothetical protein